MVTHDPLCPVNGSIFIDDPYYCCQQCNPGDIPPWERACECSLIARVRADERKQAGARVSDITYWEDGWPENVVVSRMSAIYAATGEENE